MTNAQLQIALEIATLAHKNVTRLNGDPYVFHVLRVANNAKFIKTKLQKTAAILHDVIEDTPFDAQFLREKGISPEVLDVLALLTHKKDEVSYEEYIQTVCTNLDAMLIKLSDLTDNLDQGTLSKITERDRERFMVYEQAKTTIMSVLATKHPAVFKDILNKK